jgi:uncharacterized protein YheU (UPF0270 family)
MTRTFQRIEGTRMDEPQDDRDRPLPIAVPHEELSEEALLGVVESFVLREGTDYGAHDMPHASKVAQVRRQLERGEAQILFDPVTESIDIVIVPPAARRKRAHD